MNASLPLLQPLPSHLDWRHPYAELGESFYTAVGPWPIELPRWGAISAGAAALIGLDAATLRADPGWLQALAGNRPISGTRPLASVYSGHQFGHWAGQLGDGRALLLGSVNGWEVQLKGSGRTPYSRMGDGRAVLRSSIREFLASEAMAALGVPTTRALCIVASSEPVARERLETGAVVTRLAPSFVRFGHFEHFAARQDLHHLRRLADFVIDQHLPQCQSTAALDANAGNPYAALLDAVTTRTAKLLAHWQTLGFCHGVMNTDNMSVLGLTLDYGPYQWMNGFDPGFVCNHTDRGGRYAYDQQPAVAHWNLYALAHALLALIEQPEHAQDVLDRFNAHLHQAMEQLAAAKLGLSRSDAADAELAQRALALWQGACNVLTHERVDYTLFWRLLARWVAQPLDTRVRSLWSNPTDIDAWLLSYSECLTKVDRALAADLMDRTNPCMVPRTHAIQAVIDAAEGGDMRPLTQALAALSEPYTPRPDLHAWQAPPPPDAPQIALSCSS